MYIQPELNYSSLYVHFLILNMEGKKHDTSEKSK